MTDPGLTNGDKTLYTHYSGENVKDTVEVQVVSENNKLTELPEDLYVHLLLNCITGKYPYEPVDDAGKERAKKFVQKFTDVVEGWE